jgi:hypothetical protein
MSHPYNLRSKGPVVPIIVAPRVCPITQDVIRDPVRTAAGIVYERAAITEWLRANESDPVARCWLPTKHLWPVAADDTRSAAEFVRTDLLWAVTLPFYHVAHQNAHPFKCDARNTRAYSKARMDDLQRRPLLYYASSAPDDAQIDAQLGVVRAPNTGTGMQCLDWRGIVDHVNFKCVDLRGSALAGSVFIGCDFGKCNFAFTDLRRVTFWGCIFRGETTIFAGAAMDGAMLVDCGVESHRGWWMANDREFADSMRARGANLDGARVVLAASQQQRDEVRERIRKARAGSVE